MRARVDAGTDVAMIGAWDARRDDQPFSPDKFAQVQALIEADATNGDLFLIHTGADGGGPVDVVIDEPIPAEEIARLKPIEGLRRLSVPSGALRIGGVEYYRAPKPRGRPDAVAIPSGDYAMAAFVPLDEEAEAPSEAALRDKVGAEQLKTYDRINMAVVMGGFAAPSLALLVLVPAYGWKIAVPVAIAAFLAWFPATQWILRRSGSYMRMHEVAIDFRLRQGPPALVLSLRKLGAEEKLAGGSVSIP
jgi:hypothetical protein